MPEGPPQLPGPGEIFLDHVGWFVADMDEAAGTFGALGFPLTPYSIHYDRDPATGARVAVGSANRLAMLEAGYLEILTPVAGADTPVARHMRDSLARHPGVHLVAFTVADAAGETDRLAAAGFALSPTVNLRRTIEGADGAPTEVAFTVVRPVLGSIPEGRMQVLTHHTPDAMWQNRYVARDNGVCGLTGAILAVPDPAASAERLSRLVNRPATPFPGGAEIELDRGRLLLLAPEAATARLGQALPAAPCVAAVELAVRDLGTTREWLTAAGISTTATDLGLVVAAASAAGTALVLHAADRPQTGG